MSDNKVYVLSKQSLKVMQSLVQDANSAPPPAMLSVTNKNYTTAPDAYWALPPCETGLPSAERDVDGKLVPGKANCCLYKFDSAINKLMPVVDGVGLPIKVLVLNYYELLTNDYVQVWRHKNGYWTNERPSAPSVPTSSTTNTTAAPQSNPLVSPVCSGQCLWQSDLNNDGQPVWRVFPFGGCKNTTTTTTTTTTTSTSTTNTTTSTTTTTTLAPCSYTPCRLRCVPVTTTTAAPGGTTGTTTTTWPISWQPTLRYEEVINQDYPGCDQPCSCYGNNDPCFLEDAEILSVCLVVVTTTTAAPTTSTTTPNPDSTPVCDFANLAEPLPMGYYRAASWKGGRGGWNVCQECSEKFIPLFKLGSIPAIDPGPESLFMIHDSVCVDSPCFEDVVAFPENHAGFKAFSHIDQKAKWGTSLAADSIIGYDDEKFLANWVLCQKCPSGMRPAFPPPEILFYDDAQNDLVEKTPGGLYKYYTACVPGPDCDSCQYSIVSNEFQGTTTTTEPTTTASPTPAPRQLDCGCVPPDFCPQVNGECVFTECKPGGNLLPDGNPAPLPVCPTTTTGPNQCWDGRKMCVCASTTTGTSTTAAPLPACSGNCSWVAIRVEMGVLSWYKASRCANSEFGCDCAQPSTSPTECGQTASTACSRPVVTTTTTSQPSESDCNGRCLYYATYTGIGSALAWELSRLRSTCGYTIGTLGGRFGCGCACPTGLPSSICDTEETVCSGPKLSGTLAQPACFFPPPYDECSCCTTLPCDKQCTYKGNAYGSWTKIADPCIAECPCPGLPETSSNGECDIRRYKCGSPAATTTTSTTTAGPGTTSTTTSTTTTTCAPTLGQCCVGNLCYETNPCICESLGGVWSQPAVVCDYGACGNTTTTTTTSTTTTTTTSTTTTTTSTTPAPLGRCCVFGTYGANCVVCRQVDCPGDWLEGETCVSSPCSGACCYETAYGQTCTNMLSQANCASLQGVWHPNLSCEQVNNCITTTTTPVTTVTVPPLLP